MRTFGECAQDSRCGRWLKPILIEAVLAGPLELRGRYGLEFRITKTSRDKKKKKKSQEQEEQMKR